MKEQRLAEVKKHERKKEEFLYNLKREQQLLKDEFEDEKAGLEKEIQLKREQMEKELAERERAVRENERELNELRKNAVAFPKELDAAVARAGMMCNQIIFCDNDLVSAEEFSPTCR